MEDEHLTNADIHEYERLYEIFGSSDPNPVPLPGGGEGEGEEGEEEAE